MQKQGIENMLNKTIAQHSYIIKITTLLFFLLFLNACSENPIKQPPLIEPSHHKHIQDSLIQIPISIDTQEIKDLIISEIPEPLSSGVSEKITAEIFATEKITTKQLYKKYEDTPTRWFNPIEASYKYISKDIAQAVNKTFKTGMWVNHKIYLKDLKIFFDGSQVHISTSYKVDISIDYEQALLPSTNPYIVKGLVNGVLEANINVVGNISIAKDAQLHIKALKNSTKVKFTKIELPSNVNLLKILKLTKLEDVLSKRLLEEPTSRYIFQQLQKQIAKKQVDIQLAHRIQKLVYENSFALSLSKDLWLIPQANKISISQVEGQGGVCANTLSINVGIVANPQLISSKNKPVANPPRSVPIVCERITPVIYLYPSLNLKYDFIADKVTKKLNAFIRKQYPNEDYIVDNISIYPSDTKLVLSLNLVEKNNPKNIFSFYLWGTPKVNAQKMHVALENLEYTIESKNALLRIAKWLLDEEIKLFLQENTLFSYKEEFTKLSKKLSNIKHTSGSKIITGKIKLLKVEDIFTSKESLIVHALATGNISYKINLRK